MLGKPQRRSATACRDVVANLPFFLTVVALIT
jgi:hypothetical protein